MTILDTRLDQHGETRMVVLVGELDLSTAEQAESILQQAEGGDPPVLGVDLRRVTFMDSTGLRLFVEAHRRAEQSGRRLVLVRGPANVHRVFQVTKLDEHLHIVDGPDDIET